MLFQSSFKIDINKFTSGKRRIRSILHHLHLHYNLRDIGFCVPFPQPMRTFFFTNNAVIP